MLQCLKITDGNSYVKKTTDYSIKYSKYMFIYCAASNCLGLDVVSVVPNQIFKKIPKKIFMLNNLCQNRCLSPAKKIIGKVLLLFVRRITILFQLLIILEVMPPLLIFLKINTLHFIIVFLLLAIR